MVNDKETNVIFVTIAIIATVSLITYITTVLFAINNNTTIVNITIIVVLFTSEGIIMGA